MPFSEAEARIRRLMAGIDGAEHEVLALRLRRGKIGQDLAISRSGFGVCTTTITGTIYGGKLLAFPGAMVHFIGNPSGIDYGWATADGSGIYSRGMQITASDTSLQLFTDYPTGGRFDPTHSLGFYSFTRCGTTTYNLGDDVNPAPARAMTAASGYVWTDPDSSIAQPCQFPIAATLNCTDSVYGGPFTVTWNGTVWVGCQVVSYPGHAPYAGNPAGCPAVTTGYHYQLAYNLGAFDLRVTAPNNGTCITAGNCSTGVGSAIAFQNTAASLVCPDPDTSTKFSVSFSAPGTLFTGFATDGYYPGSVGTITFQEP